MRLVELFKNQLDIDYSIGGFDNINEASFVASNGLGYTVNLLPNYMAPDSLYIQLPFTDGDIDKGMFADFSTEHGVKDITGTGNAFEVYAATLEALTTMIKEVQPLYVYFQGAEPSRRKLYNKLTPAIAKEFNWRSWALDGLYVMYDAGLSNEHPGGETL